MKSLQVLWKNWVKLVIKRLKEKKGLAQIPIMIGLLIMAAIIPVATNLVQKNQENRSKAEGETFRSAEPIAPPTNCGGRDASCGAIWNKSCCDGLVCGDFSRKCIPATDCDGTTEHTKKCMFGAENDLITGVIECDTGEWRRIEDCTNGCKIISGVAKCNSAATDTTTPTQTYNFYVFKTGVGCVASTNKYKDIKECNADPPINNCYPLNNEGLTKCEAENSALVINKAPVACEETCYKTEVGSPPKIPSQCSGYDKYYSGFNYVKATGNCTNGGICCKKKAVTGDAGSVDTSVTETTCRSLAEAGSNYGFNDGQTGCYTKAGNGSTCAGFEVSGYKYTNASGTCSTGAICCKKEAITIDAGAGGTAADKACAGKTGTVQVCVVDYLYTCIDGKPTNFNPAPTYCPNSCDTATNKCKSTSAPSGDAGAGGAATNDPCCLNGALSCPNFLSTGYDRICTTSAPTGFSLVSGDLSCSNGGKCYYGKTSTSCATGYSDDGTGKCVLNTSDAGQFYWYFTTQEITLTTGQTVSKGTCQQTSGKYSNTSDCKNNLSGYLSGKTTGVCYASAVECQNANISDTPTTTCSSTNCGACKSSNCSANNCLWLNDSETCLTGDGSLASTTCKVTTGIVKKCVADLLYTCIAGSPQRTGVSPENCANGCENDACKATAATTTCGRCVGSLSAKGDANCDGKIDGIDYSIWRQEFIDKKQSVINSKSVWAASFKCKDSDSTTYKTDGVDYSIWRQGYLK